MSSDVPGGAQTRSQRFRDDASRKWDGLPANMRGSLWLIASALLFTIMATLTKFLGHRLDPWQVAFFRMLFSLIAIAPWLVRDNCAAMKPYHGWLMTLRGFVGGGAMLCMVYAFVMLPLADAQAIQFAQALFMVPLAMFFVGEVPGPRRIIAVILGFIGVLIMLRPTGAVEPAALVALFGAFLVAFAAVLVKMVADKDGPLTMMFFTGVIGSLIALGPTIHYWVSPTAEEWALLIGMGIVGAGAHNCFLRAYRVGEATAIAPVDYSRLIFAAAAGFVFFGTVPDLYTILGAILIAGTAFYIARREAQVAREKAAREKAAREKAAQADPAQADPAIGGPR